MLYPVKTTALAQVAGNLDLTLDIRSAIEAEMSKRQISVIKTNTSPLANASFFQIGRV